ncbi:putative signal transducing protein [Marinicella sp. W31]|uniref:putative signal transducing protein n=1 Tax=Marinicella sp. W31 TaxID=3023713 RepID=UPI0037574CFF
MKRIFKTNEYNEALSIRGLLESAGIPAHISENGFRSRGPILPEGIDVWIYIDDQLEDAEMLMEDPNHEVREPVDIQAFYHDLDEGETSEVLENHRFQIIMYGTGLIAVMIFIIYLLVND